MRALPFASAIAVVCSLLGAAALAATTLLPISEDELASVILEPSPLDMAPLAFNRTDTLLLKGISLEFSWAEFVGDTLRLHDILLNKSNAWADLRFDGGQFFQLVQSGAGRGDPLSRPEIPGVDSSVALASMTGPPLTVRVLPIGLANQDHTVTLGEFDPDLSRFRITDFQPLNAATSDMVRGKKRATMLASAASGSDSVDSWIDAQTRVENSLPTVTDWSNAVLSCLSAGIDKLGVTSTGAEIIKVLAKDSPGALKDAYEAMALGNPADASLIISELAFKGLALKAKDKGELGAFFNALAAESDYGKALAKGAGACTVDYKEAGAVVLEGLARAAFPLSSCGVDVMIESAKQVRGLVVDGLANKVYDMYLRGGEPLVDWSVSGYGNALRTQYALKKHIDAATAEKELNTLFSTWKARQNQSGPLRVRLLQLKASWAQDRFWLEEGIRKSLPTGASEGDAFAAYVAKMNTTRARLTAFNDTLQNLDVNAALVLRGAYWHGSTVVPFDVMAWKKGTAIALQAGAPALLKSEPAVCLVTPIVDKAWVLVETTDFNPTPFNNGFYATTIGYSRGNVTIGWSTGANTFDFMSTWSNPPTVIRAGDTIPMVISLAVTANTGTDFGVSGGFGVHFDVAGIVPGYVQSPIEFRSAQGETGYLGVVRNTHPAGTTLTRSMSLAATSLRTGSDGARMALLAYIYGFQNTVGTRYTYEWKAVN